MKKLILCLALFLNGCYTQVNSLVEYLPDKDLKLEHQSIDAVLFTYLTPDAYMAVKDIPVYINPFSGGMASGSSKSSSILQFLVGAGFGRKIFVTEEALANWGIDSIIHEYIHHLDDMTRDGEGDFISLEEFEVGYASCYGHLRYHGITRHVENNNLNNQFITENFGIGKHSERIAYCGQLLWKQDCPPSLRYAYRKIFKAFANQKQPEQVEVNEKFYRYLKEE